MNTGHTTHFKCKCGYEDTVDAFKNGCPYCGDDNCPRCGHYSFVNMNLCDECQKKFDKMVVELRLAWIHQKGHPNKKTLWINVEE